MPHFEFPGGRRAALSLTFDDGLASQLEKAVPLLEKYGFKATFYLEGGGPDWRKRLAPWRKVREAGHELGNHTLHHYCSENFEFVPAGKGLESLTLETMETEIVECNRRLDELCGTQIARSFAYPCYQTFVGRGRERKSYVPLVARHCLAGRGKGERGNSPDKVDLAEVWSLPCEFKTAAELLGQVELYLAKGQWGIFTFHGVDDGHLPIASQALEQLLQYLDARRDVVWVAPVAEVAGKLIENREKRPAGT